MHVYAHFYIYIFLHMFLYISTQIANKKISIFLYVLVRYNNVRNVRTFFVRDYSITLLQEFFSEVKGTLTYIND